MAKEKDMKQIRIQTIKRKKHENRKEKERKTEKQTTVIGTWNVRSIKGKEEEIVEEMEKYGIDILGITETKKKNKGRKCLNNGYHMLWSGVDIKQRAREGVGLILKKDWIGKIIKEDYINERLLQVELEFINKSIWNIIVAYAPNDDALKEEKDLFFNNLQMILDRGVNNKIVLGDLNGRVGNDNTGIERNMGTEGEQVKNNNGERIINLSIDNDFVITNTKFKHKDIHKFTREEINRGEKSIIDYILINRENWKYVKDCKVIRQAEIGSDHYLLKTVLKYNQPNTQQIRRKITKEKIKSYKLKESRYRQKYQEILSKKIEESTNEEGVERKWKQLKDMMLQAAKESCGSSKITNKNIKKTKWWSKDLKRKIKEKKDKWKKYLVTRRKEDYEEYKNCRQQVKIKVKEAKKESWKEFGESMRDNYTENQKLFYGTLKQLRNTKTFTMKNIKDKNGKVLTEEKDILERWKQYFKDLTNTKETDKDTEQKDIITEEKINNNEENIPEITSKELENAIAKIKLGKAPGIDDVTPEMIKYMDESGKEKLRELLNTIINEKIIPNEWNIGIVLPIHKKGDTRNCENYRGITLTCIGGKVLARILEERIRIELDNTLEETQYGFRKGRSTQDPIFIIRQATEKTISKGGELHVCFIDLEKAFDRIKREDVWNILQERGINIGMIEMLRAMYRNNQNVVRIQNEESKIFQTKTGLKQGCVLSPLLFSVVMDKAVKEAKVNMKKFNIGNWKMEKVEMSELLFADDMAIVANSAKDLQQNINAMNESLKRINMKININKTKSMIISTQHQTHEIHLEEKIIEQVKCYNYLGTTIEDTGKLDREINERTGKVGRLFNAMRTTFLGKREIPKNIKVEVVKKVVIPTLIYGSESWTLTDRNMSRVNATEMRFLRKIEGKTRRDRIRNEVFRENLKIKPIEKIIQEKQLSWLGHIYRMPEIRQTRRIYEARPLGKNKRGRPRRTWKAEVQRAATERNIEWNQIHRLSQDRKAWKKVVKT